MPRPVTKPLYNPDEYHSLKTREEIKLYKKTHRMKESAYQTLNRMYPKSPYKQYQRKWVLLVPNTPINDLDNIKKHYEKETDYITIYHQDEYSITYILSFKKRIYASKFRYMDSEWNPIPHTVFFE